MSRVANYPIKVPNGVEITIAGSHVTVKGKNGELAFQFTDLVGITHEDAQIRVKAATDSKKSVALSGTTRAVLQNMVTGVSEGFERRLNIVGVGYRAQVKGNVLNLSLGFSHPVDFEIPDGITIETPSQTEIVVKGIDKQRVGQVAANLRAYRPPEPYKGKGVRYADEVIVKKEAKKN
jgi:large subunit ribosomal protein L6